MSLKLCVRDRGFLYINTHYRFKVVEEMAKKMTLRKYKGVLPMLPVKNRRNEL